MSYTCALSLKKIKDYLAGAAVVGFDFETSPIEEYRSEGCPQGRHYRSEPFRIRGQRHLYSAAAPGRAEYPKAGGSYGLSAAGHI